MKSLLMKEQEGFSGSSDLKCRILQNPWAEEGLCCYMQSGLPATTNEVSWLRPGK